MKAPECAGGFKLVNDYAAMTLKELVAYAAGRGVDTKGTKDDLVARLERL